MKISDDISKCLERIDRFMDHYGLSPINNLVNCITKTCIRIYRKCYPNVDLTEKRKQSFLGHYFDYIDKKNGKICVVGLVPFLGSVVIYSYDKRCENKKFQEEEAVLELDDRVVSGDSVTGKGVEENFSGDFNSFVDDAYDSQLDAGLEEVPDL